MPSGGIARRVKPLRVLALECGSLVQRARICELLDLDAALAECELGRLELGAQLANVIDEHRVPIAGSLCRSIRLGRLQCQRVRLDEQRGLPAGDLAFAAGSDGQALELCNVFARGCQEFARLLVGGCAPRLGSRAELRRRSLVAPLLAGQRLRDGLIRASS
jgi:hypothetical protein